MAPEPENQTQKAADPLWLYKRLMFDCLEKLGLDSIHGSIGPFGNDSIPISTVANLWRVLMTPFLSLGVGSCLLAEDDDWDQVTKFEQWVWVAMDLGSNV